MKAKAPGATIRGLWSARRSRAGSAMANSSTRSPVAGSSIQPRTPGSIGWPTRSGVTLPRRIPVADGEKNVATLKSLTGAAFDKAYIDHEVAYHQAVLDALDKTLIPGASNAELKALLVKVRPAFVAHLEHAKTIQASLK